MFQTPKQYGRRAVMPAGTAPRMNQTPGIARPNAGQPAAATPQVVPVPGMKMGSSAMPPAAGVGPQVLPGIDNRPRDPGGAKLPNTPLGLAAKHFAIR